MTASARFCAYGQVAANRSRSSRAWRESLPGIDSRQPESFGFPAAGGMGGQGEHLRPGEQVGGERDELAPDLVRAVAGERYLQPLNRCP